MSTHAIPLAGCTCVDCENHRALALQTRTLVEGVKLDDGKVRTDLLPPDALLEVAGVLSFGAGKYAPRNWEKGMSWGRLTAALLRHVFAWMAGTDIDTESGFHHLSHAACCALMLLALVKRGHGTDDRKQARQ